MNLSVMKWCLVPALALALLSPIGRAQEKKAEPVGDPAKIGPQTKALEALNGAFKMVDYGRDKKVPEALIVAARVIGLTEIQKPGKEDEIPKSAAADFDGLKQAESLIAEALKMESAKADVIKLLAEKTRKDLADAEQSRGNVGGPKAIRGTMKGVDDFDTFRLNFRGGEPAEIMIRVEPSTADVDLRIVDEDSGQMVARDRRADDDCFVRWYPKTTKRYLVEVRNYRRNINVTYNLFTN